MKFSLKKSEMVFIQDYLVWITIFEDRSIEKIQTRELKQLIHLKTFSLELNRKENCLRVYIYSKSCKELEQRIKSSKPILEAILPDIKLISASDALKLLKNLKLLEINKKYVLKENSELIFPMFKDLEENFSPSFSSMILSYRDEANGVEVDVNEKKWAQLYYFYIIDHFSFFKDIEKILVCSQSRIDELLLNIQEIQRIKIRYQLNNKQKIEFQSGLDCFKKGLSLLLLELKRVTTRDKIDFSPKNALFNDFKQFLSTSENVGISIGMNQICSELCNITRNSNLIQEEKEERCSRRTDFCQKLLINDNFLSILDNMLNQKYETEIVPFISELRRHLSYQQLICVIAHLTQLKQYEISCQRIIKILLILFQLHYKVQESLNFCNRPISKTINSNTTVKKISLSSTPN